MVWKISSVIFYPSLNKHNSSNYYVANASKKTQWQFKCDFL